MGFWREFFIGPEETSLEVSPPALDVREAVPATEHTERPLHWGTGAGLTTGDALSLTSVYRSISILITAGSQLSIDCYKADQPTSTTPLWVQRPDMKLSRSAWIGQVITSLALTGNAFLRVIRDNDLDPTSPIRALIVLNPHDTFHVQDGQGNVVGYTTSGLERQLRPHEVKHLALMRVPGNPRGLGPIQAAREDLFAATETRAYGARFFDTSGVPSGILKTDQKIPAEKAAEVRDQWNSNTGRGVRVLGDGLDYKPIFVSPEDAQFLQSREFSTAEIARLFGIPARLLLIANGSEDYANVQQADSQFIRWTLAQYLRELEEALSDLLPRGTVARMNYEAFLRPTTTERYNTYSLGISAGWLLKSEVRAIEGLPPVEGIDDAPAAVQDAEIASSDTQEASDDA